MYVFFLDAAPTEHLISQIGSLLTFLEEEDDLGAEGGGKLRKSILLGAASPPCMAALRAMALVCDAVLWPLLKALKPPANKHVLDVLPKVWTEALAFFDRAAAAPAGLIDGSLRLAFAAEAAAPPATGAQAKRSARAQIDMARIRGVATGNPLVERLVAAACAAMATSTKNHAAEWLGPDGKLCSAKHTPELRAKYDALVAVSTPVERIHALGRCADDRGGMQRPEQRAGLVLARFNNQAEWLLLKEETGLARALNICRSEARLARRQTLKQQRVASGRSKRAERETKLSSKRAKRAARAAEEQRISALTVATKYSELVKLSNAGLSDQLKAHKLARKKAKQEVSFTATQKNRMAYVLRLQALLTEADASANDLAEGDDGTLAVGVVRVPRGTKPAKKQKLADACGNVWEKDDEFEDFVILRTRASRGAKAGDKGRKGSLLYYIAWEGFSADASTWEPASNVGAGAIKEYHDSLREEAEADGAAEAELESSDDESEDDDAAE